MKNRSFLMIVVVIVVSVFLVSPVMAGERWEAGWNLTKKGAGFGAGILAGAVGHYGAHWIMMKGLNVDNEWDSPKSYRYYTDSPQKSALIAEAGFLSQIIGTEIVLGWDKIPKDNYFVLGYLTWNIANPIIYTLAREFKISNFGDGYGDLENLDNAGIKAEYVEVVIVGQAVFALGRLLASGVLRKLEIPFVTKLVNVSEGFTFRATPGKVGVFWEMAW